MLIYYKVNPNVKNCKRVLALRLNLWNNTKSIYIIDNNICNINITIYNGI